MQIHPVTKSTESTESIKLSEATDSTNSTDSICKPPPLRCSECNKLCSCPQELERHISLAHLPSWLHCLHFPCTWRGHHKDGFKKHLREHPSLDPNVGPCLIYEIKLVQDWIKDRTPVKTAATYTLDFISDKALELGFVEEWKCHGPFNRAGLGSHDPDSF